MRFLILGLVGLSEKVYIPSSKPYITFQGAGLHKTIITWSDNANVTGSTYTTASVAVDADHFIGRNISFKVNIQPYMRNSRVDINGWSIYILKDGVKC